MIFTEVTKPPEKIKLLFSFYYGYLLHFFVSLNEITFWNKCYQLNDLRLTTKTESSITEVL